MSGDVVRMDEYRERVIVETDSGERYEYTLEHLERVADGREPLDALHPDALRCIVQQWIAFIPIISEFAEGEDG